MRDELVYKLDKYGIPPNNECCSYITGMTNNLLTKQLIFLLSVLQLRHIHYSYIMHGMHVAAVSIGQ